MSNFKSMAVRGLGQSLAIGALLTVVASVSRADLMYHEAVLAMNPSVYYRLNQPAGVADNAVEPNLGTLGTPYNGYWGSNLSGYDGRQPTSGVAGPRPTDVIGGKPLLALEAGNFAAAFAPTTVSNMLSIFEDGTKVPSALDTPGQTYAMFFRATERNGWTRIITTHPDFDHQFQLTLDTANPDGSFVLVNQNTTSAAYKTSQSYLDGEWHHLVLIRDSDDQGDMRLYVDGSMVDLLNRGGTWGAGWQFRFGAQGTGSGNAFMGNLDEIAIWNRALTHEEAIGLFGAALVPEPSTCVLLLLAGVTALLGSGRRKRR